MSNLNNKPNILFLVTAGFPYGNSETFLENEIESLCKEFDKVVIITHDIISERKRNTHDSVEIHRLNYSVKGIQKLKSIFFIFNPIFWNELRIIRKTYNKKISLVIFKTALISLFNAKCLAYKYLKIAKNYENSNHYFYSYWSNDSAIAISLLKKENSTIISVSRIHGWDVYFETSICNYLPYRHFLSMNLNSIYSISEDGINYCRNTWQIPNKNRIQLSRLGVRKQEALSENNDVFTIVSCSNVIPLKRVELIYQSVKLASVDRKIRWIHYGDGVNFKKLQEGVNVENSSSLEVILKGRLENSVVLEEYKTIKPNLFINLSTSEGVPVSIMEAMSFGIPVIATDVGGTGEIVNKENGILLSSDSTSHEVASIIEKFQKLSNEDKVKKRKSAYSTWENEFNADENYSEFVERIINL